MKGKKIIKNSSIFCLLMSTVLSCCFLSGCNLIENRSNNVTVRRIDYKGWPDSVELTNGDVRVVVVPAIGRIMYYGFIDGDNVLYENPDLYGKILTGNKPMTENGEAIWAQFGGDRVWPTEENNFVVINGHKRPPDHWIDGLSWNWQLLNNGVVITSRVSEYCGARVIREIKLAPTGSRVTIHQRMEKIKPGLKNQLEPLPLTIWNISQVTAVEEALISLSRKSCFKDRVLFYKWDDYDNQAYNNFETEGDMGLFTVDPVRMQKVGADSTGWIAAIAGTTVMAELFEYDQQQIYPDGGTSIAIFTCPEFTELECLSPLKKLRIGEIMEYDIAWELFQLPHEVEDTREKRRLTIQKLKSIR